MRKQDLLDAISETEKKPDDYHKCEKLATYYTLLAHLYPEPEPAVIEGYSFDSHPAGTVGCFGTSDFLTAMSGKDEQVAWELMDELMQALSVLNPRLHESVMSKLNT